LDWAIKGQSNAVVNGQSIAEERVKKTRPNSFSADETADGGIGNQTP
jgi:hypothetical protein